MCLHWSCHPVVRVLADASLSRPSWAFVRDSESFGNAMYHVYVHVGWSQAMAAAVVVQVLRGGEWRKIPGEMLLPGDVFFLTLPPRKNSDDDDDDDAALVPVDALLLGGGVIADESVLTGESTPQWKEPIAGGDVQSPERFRPLDVTRDKLHVLFGGTKIRNVTNGELPSGRGAAPGGGAPAVVLRTGFETAQGRLMRTILMSTERLTANTVESGLFICFLLLFAVSAAGALRGQSWQLLLHAAHGNGSAVQSACKMLLAQLRGCVRILSCTAHAVQLK